MTLYEAVAAAQKLTGQVYDQETMFRWLSEFDGQVAFEVYRAESWTPYTNEDADSVLLVPFPYDKVYVHHLEAMTYYSDGEYDRYDNASAMANAKLGEFKRFVERTRDCCGRITIAQMDGVSTVSGSDVWRYVSAYGTALLHGYTGTEEEWLASLIGPQGEAGADGADGADGYSPAVTITSIIGGHRVTITDEDHPSGQSFDVMNGQDGAGDMLKLVYDNSGSVETAGGIAAYVAANAATKQYVDTAVASAGKSPYVHSFTASDWTAGTDDATLTIAAATHGLTGNAVLAQFWHQVNGVYQFNTWACIESWAEIDASTHVITLHGPTTPYAGKVVLFG